MPLFLDRLPFAGWTDRTRTPPRDHWYIVLPVFVTEPSLSAPTASTTLQHWVLDTGNSGEAFAWRHHLHAAGLDPDKRRSKYTLAVTSSLHAGKQQVPVRDADLWLVSNLVPLQGAPIRLELEQGIPFRDVPQVPDPRFQRPLIGMRTMLRAGVKVELDYVQKTVSLWTPDAPAPP